MPPIIRQSTARDLLGLRRVPARRRVPPLRRELEPQGPALRMNFSLGLFWGKACCGGVRLLGVVGDLFKVQALLRSSSLFVYN